MPKEQMRNQFPAEPCQAGRARHAVAYEIFRRLGDKWSLPVLHSVDLEGTRYSDLRRSVEGISNRMLTATLRRLEHDGLVARTVLTTTPLQVRYRLTPLGHSLLGVVERVADSCRYI